MKQRRDVFPIAVLGCLLVWGFSGLSALALEQDLLNLQPGQAVAVDETFDGKSFTYEVVDVQTKEHCLVVRLRYPSPVVSELPQNNVIPVEYYLPKGIQANGPRRPAVICLHILDGSLELVRMLASVLASHGVPAVVFQLPYYGPRGDSDGPYRILADPQHFVSVLEQAFLEVKRAVDFLASRLEVNPQHIGVAGISLGAIIAASAAEREPRIYKAGLILAGGNLRQIVETAREAEPLRRFIADLDADQQASIWKILDTVDPLSQADLLKERAQQGRVLMINAAEDEVIPRACTEQLAAALGIADRVFWLNDLGHYTALAALPRILELTAEFFAADLPADVRVKETPSAEMTPVQLIAATLQRLTEFYLREPTEGACHIGQIRAHVNGDEYTFLFIRGAGESFRLEGRASDFGQVMLGQRDYPWMMARTGLVFVGQPDAGGKPQSPLSFVNNALLERARFAVLAVSGLSASPPALEALIRVKEEQQSDGRTIIVSPVDDTNQIAVRLKYARNQRFPNRLEIEGVGREIRVEIETWEIDVPAPVRLFDPPSDKPQKVVSRYDLYRMFGAVINFLAEKAP